MASPSYITQQSAVWAEQFYADPTFTTSDIEELKDHLIELAEELHSKGLTEEEALLIASTRLGVGENLKNEYREINAPAIQLRNTVLVLSGVLLFFLLYFFMFFSFRFTYVVMYDFGVDKYVGVYYVRYYLIAYQLFFVTLIVSLFFDRQFVEKLGKIRIKPRHSVLLFISTMIFALFNKLLGNYIEQTLVSYPNLSYKFLLYDDYFGNIFGLIIILGFICLYKKHARNSISEFQSNSNASNRELQDNLGVEAQVSCMEEFKQDLQRAGLTREEINKIVKQRMGIDSHTSNSIVSQNGGSMNYLLIIMSGVLVYFFLYYFLFASGKALFTTLQHFHKDSVLNIRRTWTYFLVFQWIIVLFTAGLYFLDKNLVCRLKKIHIRPSHTIWLLSATIVLGIVDRMFYPIIKHAIEYRVYMALYLQLADIFLISTYTLPFLICACFLILFHRYYRDYVKTGN